MSIVIAIKHNDMVSFISDSQTTRGYLKTTLTNDSERKLNHINGIVLGTVGHKIVGTLLRGQCESNILPQEIPLTKEWIVKKIVNPLFRLLEDKNLLDENNDQTKELDSRALIAKNDKLFSIRFDGSVIEVPNYAIIGSGSDYAMPHLMQTNKTSSQKAIKTNLIRCMQEVENFDYSVGAPYIYIDTKELKATIEGEI